MTQASYLYLHGFASSPASRKAGYFVDRCAERGITLRVPDLNVPSFESLTLTAMIERAVAEVNACPPGPVHVIGSSMGGLVAIHLADRYPGLPISSLLLFAPAMDFYDNRGQQFGGEGLRRWKETGTQAFTHHSTGQQHEVHYGLVEDILQYNTYTTNVILPTLIFHGFQDESVDYRQSVRYALPRPLVTLRLLQADHELLAPLPRIWQEVVKFWGI